MKEKSLFYCIGGLQERKNRQESDTVGQRQLLLSLEKDGFLKRYAPYLNKITVSGNSIIIRDEKLQRLVEVIYRDNKF